MKQLSIIEIESISGGYSWDFSSLSGAVSSIAGNAAEAVASCLLGASMTGAIGSFMGGYYAGLTGGKLGVGIIAAGVGMIWGLGVGGIAGGIAATLLGWDTSSKILTDMFNGVIDGTFTPWKA
ncbi:hypothetical protein LXH16_01395 [Klebsiella oxytoca]|uniref:hypothetical protein n=2 Tax=Klebsiella oxytoca TaxID=571 RepID=UPI0018888498|nr:hypothetical protein [Klebsiella oxytoca]MBF1894034.1 hypothetical protein [Klebsiella oxytoca]MBF1899836.1 hypothetical protein [Klebsiella oxytoca]MBF9153635.1 hypothetical protein [Klebsiella oxytoca]UIM60818.1 hypothetical protein LXH16_01395 [Klebsiella oxytoca]WPI53276.1 hypothetical protein R8547_25075 [Klebsiella oxytoca]